MSGKSEFLKRLAEKLASKDGVLAKDSDELGKLLSPTKEVDPEDMLWQTRRELVNDRVAKKRLAEHAKADAKQAALEDAQSAKQRKWDEEYRAEQEFERKNSEKVLPLPSSNPEMAAKNADAQWMPDGSSRSGNLLEIMIDPELVRKTYMRPLKAIAPMAAGLDNPLDMIGDAMGGYDDLKKSVMRKAAEQMNLSGNKTDEEVMADILSMGADPLNAIEGPVGLGLGAMQMIPRRKK